MYRLSYLPLAKKDIEASVSYIANHLGSPDAALKLLDNLESAIKTLQDYPYSHPLFRTIRPLSEEFRVIPVSNYAVFYVVREPDKVVEISRVIYARRDILGIFNSSGNEFL